MSIQVTMIFARSLVFFIIASHQTATTEGQYTVRPTTASLERKQSSQRRPEQLSTMVTTLSRRSTSSEQTTSRVSEPRPPATFPLQDSDCFCSYDVMSNLLSCSPSLQNFPSSRMSREMSPIINITLSDCNFFNNHFNLPIFSGQEIDHLHLYDINRQDYLLFDHDSFFPYRIHHIYIYYTFVAPITMLLLSNETFASPSISHVLTTLHIDSCYLLTVDSPFRYLRALQSITLIDIEHFSWYDFNQEIRQLPQLRWIDIVDETELMNNDTANVIACRDVPTQWIFSYRYIQTCGCEFVALLNSTRRFGDQYQCVNSSNAIDFLANVCRANGKVYEIKNQTNQFCQRCVSYGCPSWNCLRRSIRFSATVSAIVQIRLRPSPPTNTEHTFDQTVSLPRESRFLANQRKQNTRFSGIQFSCFDSDRFQSESLGKFVDGRSFLPSNHGRNVNSSLVIWTLLFPHELHEHLAKSAHLSGPVDENNQR